VVSHLQRALAAEGSGDTAEAERIRKQILKDYGRYTDLTGLLGTGPAPAEAPSTPLAPKPPSDHAPGSP
jgi:hypothetical protein